MDVTITVPSDTWYDTDSDSVSLTFDVDGFVIDGRSDTNFSAYVEQQIVIRPTLMRADVEITTASGDGDVSFTIEGDALSVLNGAATEVIAHCDDCFDDVDTIVNAFVRNMRWEVK